MKFLYLKANTGPLPPFFVIFSIHMKYEIRTVHPEELYSIRQKILRPTQTIEDCKYPGDFDKSNFHMGLFGPELLCIASFYKESHEFFESSEQYRLRGMATLAEYQGRGLATKLLARSIEELIRRKAQLLWCNARVSAEGFYNKLGFEKFGNEFDIHPIGPHFVYMKQL